MLTGTAGTSSNISTLDKSTDRQISIVIICFLVKGVSSKIQNRYLAKEEMQEAILANMDKDFEANKVDWRAYSQAANFCLNNKLKFFGV